MGGTPPVPPDSPELGFEPVFHLFLIPTQHVLAFHLAQNLSATGNVTAWPPDWPSPVVWST